MKWWFILKNLIDNVYRWWIYWWGFVFGMCVFGDWIGLVYVGIVVEIWYM